MSETKNSILIIDDELENIKALKFILGKDYTVYAERVSKEALGTVKRLMPDIVLLDVIMPDIDGFEIIGYLKAEKTTKDIPIIFVTGRTDSDDEVKGFSLGAVDYINKPFSAPVVKMRIAHQMKIINQMREIKNLSATDILTGVGNRRFFNTLISQEWESAKRQQSCICILLFDIDNFKIFNDSYGHIAGDKALKIVADVIASSLTRATDKVARWGGEEFAVVLPNTPLSGAKRVAENIRAEIEKTEIQLDDGTVTSITVSGGIQCIIPDRTGDCNLDDLFTGADEAMYRAKRGGKNRVYVAGEVEE